MAQTYIIRDYFDHEHNCMTFVELRALLDQAGRHSAFYTICLLGLATGMRCDELLRLTTYHLSTDLRHITYVVAKASKQQEGSTIVLRRKHRTVDLDEWVAMEVRCYLQRSCRVVDGVFVSPYVGQSLWPWRGTKVFNVIFSKHRLKLLSKGFDVARLESCSTLRGNAKRPTYICRFHKLRHIALTLKYYRADRDLKVAQQWIKHSKMQTTDGYIHTPAQLGVTEFDLRNKTLQALLGYDTAYAVVGSAPSQTCIDMFYDV